MNWFQQWIHNFKIHRVMVDSWGSKNCEHCSQFNQSIWGSIKATTKMMFNK